VPSLVKIGPVVLECKSLQIDGQTDGQKDDGQRAIRKVHFSSGELKIVMGSNSKLLQKISGIV
jgi:hypothetical protein